jgi:hypothetical protein
MLAIAAQPDPSHPSAPAFLGIERTFLFDARHDGRMNPFTMAVVDRVCAWAERHGLAPSAQVAKAMQRARFNVLAGYGHPDADEQGFYLTARWCTWLFFQDDLLCDRKPEHGGMLGPSELAAEHRVLLAALRGELPKNASPLASSIHEIGQDILARRDHAHLDRFAQDVADYLFGNEWEALNRVRGEVPSVSAFVKMRLHAGAAYTAFQFWEIADDFALPERDHVAAYELRVMANNCISWANDLYSLHKEVHEHNPNNLVLALANEQGCSLEAAMRETVRMYNLEYRAFQRLSADLHALGVGNLGPYADKLHGWMLGNIRWSRMTPRYRENISMRG